MHASPSIQPRIPRRHRRPVPQTLLANTTPSHHHLRATTLSDKTSGLALSKQQIYPRGAVTESSTSIAVREAYKIRIVKRRRNRWRGPGRDIESAVCETSSAVSRRRPQERTPTTRSEERAEARWRRRRRAKARRTARPAATTAARREVGRWTETGYVGFLSYGR